MLQRKFDDIVKYYYPNALDAKDTSIHYLGIMQSDYNIKISRVLLATSFCSDDITQPAVNFFDVLFGPFNLGGLGGLPFAGNTGMGAFAHHIPDDGAALLLYGPHVGVTLDGELGKMHRPRVEKSGPTCGALMGALKKFQDNPNHLPVEDENDYQQFILESLVAPHKDRFLNNSNPVREITNVLYEIINQKMHETVERMKGEFTAKKIILLGGILIHTDFGFDDYFDARNFEVINFNND